MNTIALRNHSLTAVTFAVLFWALAAVGVTAVHQVLEPASALLTEIVKIVIVLACAATVTLFGVRTIEGALFTGIAWGVLSIVVEIVATENSGHGWFALLGPPSHAALRDLMLATWIFSPALFARRRQ